MRIQLACCPPRKSCSNFSDLFNIVTPFFQKVAGVGGGSRLLGFAFLYKDFPLEDFCFEFQYKARASKVRQTEGRREGGGTLSGVLTQQRAEQISSCIISSSICSCLQKGLSVGMWVWMGYQCCARDEQSRGGGDKGGSSSLSLSLLGHLASQLLSQALFINQIKFIWPPAAAPLLPPPPLPNTPTAMLILCLSEAHGGRKRGGGKAARSRRCQLPIS